MRRSYVKGLRAALRRWPVAALLFAASCVPSFVFSALAWSWLADALDRSLATRGLLTDLDMNVFVDLLEHHGEGLWMLGLAGLLLAGVCWLIGVWLNAVTIVAVSDDMPLAAAAHKGLDLYVRFLGLDLLAVLIDALVLIATVAVSRWLIHATAEAPSEAAVYVIVGGAAAAGGTLLALLTTAHDHARIHCAATGAGALGSYGWALGFVVAQERRALPLMAMLLGTGGAAWLVYQSVGTLLVTTSTPGILLAMLWGEALILCRVFLRLWRFAAQAELQNLSEVAAA